ncbi:LysR family transcriptional regulator [Cupriavidus basilensis]
MVDLHYLRAFQEIVRCGTIGRAAEVLNVTQPTLTRVIKRLETQVGVRLFERHPHGMSLTEYGRSLEPYANLLVAESANALHEMQLLRGLAKGVARIGAIPSAANSVVPAAVARLLQRFPGLEVHVSEGLADELSRALAKGDIDLLVTFAMEEHTGDLQLIATSQPLEGSHIVTAPSHRLQSTSGLGLADLLEEKWVMPPRQVRYRQEWQQAFQQHGISPPRVCVETRSLETIRSLVGKFGFVSWMPYLLYETQCKTGQIMGLPVAQASVPRHLAVYRRRRGSLPSPAVHLLTEVLDAMEALTAS